MNVREISVGSLIRTHMMLLTVKNTENYVRTQDISKVPKTLSPFPNLQSQAHNAANFIFPHVSTFDNFMMAAAIEILIGPI